MGIFQRKTAKAPQTPGPEGPFDLFRCVVSVSAPGRRSAPERQGAIRFYENEMTIASRTTANVIADLFFRFSRSEPEMRERMRFGYSGIDRVYFTGERTVRFELADGSSASVILTYLNRDGFIRLLEKHGIAFEPYPR